jgi:lipid A 3-O-deacylase
LICKIKYSNFAGWLNTYTPNVAFRLTLAANALNRLAWLLLGFFLTYPALAQRNTLQLIRISEDNDGLNTRREISDRQYTNGTRLEVFYTKQTKRRFLSALLIPLAGQVNNMYSIGLTHLMYTPTDIKKKTIIKGDRPYTATLYATHALTSSDPENKQRLTTELGLGVLGRAALGEELQLWIHRQLGFDKPQGWQHQLPTDVVINYLIQYEKQLVQPSANLQVLGLLSTNLGTLSNNVNAGLIVRAGLFSDYFSNYERQTSNQRINPYRKFQLFFFVRPTVRFVMNDSVLQGGIFTHRQADYVLNSDFLNHAFMQVEYGGVLMHNRLGISFSEKLITPQFKGAPSQQVGNITLFVGI